MEGYVTTVIEFVKANQGWAPLVIFLLTFAESMCVLSLIVPAWAMIVAFGPLMGATGIPVWPIIFAAALGAILGDAVSYWVGYYFRDSIGKMWPLSRHPDILPKGQAFFDKWGFWAIFIMRFSGPLRASVSIVAGMVAMTQWKFQVANVISAFVWVIVLLLPGSFLGQYLNWLN